MKRDYKFYFMILLIVFVASGLLFSAVKIIDATPTETPERIESRIKSDTVTLFISGGERGYLKPCGCSEGQVGGISRRDSLLTSIREQFSSVIPIANGNLIFNMSRQSEIKADVGFFCIGRYGLYCI